MRSLFYFMKIIFDYNRTLYNPETDSLYQGAIELLTKLSESNELFLVTREDEYRRDKMEKLGIKKYFTEMIFVKRKTKELLNDLMKGSRDVLIVGDRATEEIALGKELGYIAVWIRRGKFFGELPLSEELKPDYTINDIAELNDIVAKYEK